MAVAPLAGAWIEIPMIGDGGTSHTVAPLAGAWIEIMLLAPLIVGVDVAPLAGAWIEMTSASTYKEPACGRSSRGSVD